MNPIQAVREGISRLAGTRRMWSVFWFYNLFFAFAVVLPLSAMVSRDLGHSAYARQMLGNFELQWLSEFYLKSSGWPLTSYAVIALVVGAGYFLLSTFLYGGALTILTDPECRYNSAAFYEGCGRNFGRLFRLLLLSAVFYGLVLIGGGLLHQLGDRIWENGMEARPLVIFNWFRVGLMLLLLLGVNMVFDYAKIRLVAEDSRKAVRAGLGSFVLAGRYLGRCAATYGIVALLFVALYLIYAAVSGPVPRETAWGLLLLLLMQQAFIVSRIWVKLLFLSSQGSMYESLKPPPAPEAQTELPETHPDQTVVSGEENA